VSRRPAALEAPISHLIAHRRLVFCAIAGIVVALVWHGPGAGSATTRVLIGWNALVWLYLAWVVVTVARADSGHIKRLALAQAESSAVALVIVVSAAVMSLVAVVIELVAAKAAGPHHLLPHLIFAFMSVIGSWLLLPMLFALSYASAYYGPEPDRGLAFPGAPEGFEPDHTDFLYFSFTIAVTAQTSDVGVTTRTMRRLVLTQSLLSFVFNTTILAFSINAAASFF
jgi:uncharacterized membrane protein